VARSGQDQPCRPLRAVLRPSRNVNGSRPASCAASCLPPASARPRLPASWVYPAKSVSNWHTRWQAGGPDALGSRGRPALHRGCRTASSAGSSRACWWTPPPTGSSVSLPHHGWQLRHRHPDQSPRRAAPLPGRREGHPAVGRPAIPPQPRHARLDPRPALLAGDRTPARLHAPTSPGRGTSRPAAESDGFAGCPRWPWVITSPRVGPVRLASSTALRLDHTPFAARRPLGRMIVSDCCRTTAR
jgi:hypothetical protein